VLAGFCGIEPGRYHPPINTYRNEDPSVETRTARVEALKAVYPPSLFKLWRDNWREGVFGACLPALPRGRQAGGARESSETGRGQHRHYKTTYINLSWTSQCSSNYNADGPILLNALR